MDAPWVITEPSMPDPSVSTSGMPHPRAPTAAPPAVASSTARGRKPRRASSEARSGRITALTAPAITRYRKLCTDIIWGEREG